MDSLAGKRIKDFDDWDLDAADDQLYSTIDLNF